MCMTQFVKGHLTGPNLFANSKTLILDMQHAFAISHQHKHYQFQLFVNTNILMILNMLSLIIWNIFVFFLDSLATSDISLLGALSLYAIFPNSSVH